MDSDTQNQVQVECRKAETGDSDGIIPSCARTRNHCIERFRHSCRTESGPTAPPHRCRHWIRWTIFQTRETSGQSLELANNRGTRSHGQNRSSYAIVPTKRSPVRTSQRISREETKHEKSDERFTREDPERDRLAEVSSVCREVTRHVTLAKIR